jgi:hypothetical protein
MNSNQSILFQKTCAVSGIVGPIINAIIFTLLGFLWSNYNPVSQLISELATPSAPHRIIMNILGFNVFGIYVILFSLGLYQSLKKHTLTKISLILFVISGLSIFTLAMFPCDEACLGTTPLGIGHNFLTVFPSLAIPVAIFLLIFPLWRDRKWHWYSLIFFFEIAIFLAIFIPLIIIFNFWLIRGVIQRLGLGILIIWIFIISTKVYRL